MNTSSNCCAAVRQVGLLCYTTNIRGALFGAILRVVHSTEIAEEVLQDTFTKVWRNFESYDASKGRLFTWLD